MSLVRVGWGLVEISGSAIMEISESIAHVFARAWFSDGTTGVRREKIGLDKLREIMRDARTYRAVRESRYARMKTAANSGTMALPEPLSIPARARLASRTTRPLRLVVKNMASPRCCWPTRDRLARRGEIEASGLVGHNRIITEA